MARIRVLLALLVVAGLIAGCVPAEPDSVGRSETIGTPDEWALMHKGTRTPLLRTARPPVRPIEVGPVEIEEFPEVEVPPQEPEAPPAPATPATIDGALQDLTQVYIVQKGDMLVKIAKRFQITDGLIRRLNSMHKDAHLIHIGQRLRVVRGPFRVLVDTKAMKLTAFLGQKAVKTWPVGLGTDDNDCPRGRFRIMEKLPYPRWDYAGRHAPPGDPNNPIGSRWIKFAPSFGVHGTNDPQSIGKRSSAGCIRMHNSHVEEVYDLVRVGGEVIVQ